MSDKFYVHQTYSEQDKIYVIPPENIQSNGFVLLKPGYNVRPELYVDIPDKSVSVIDQKGSSRITNLQQKSFYVYPKSEDSFAGQYTTQTQLFQILKELSNKDNRIKQCVIKADESYNGKTVEEFLSVGRNSDIAVANNTPFYAFHGTSKKVYDLIKTEGMKTGRREQSYNDLIKGYSEQNLYFSFSAVDARKYAARQAGTDGSAACVLKVKISDRTKIRPDEDMLKGWSKSLKNNDKFQNYIKSVIGEEKYNELGVYDVHSSNIFDGRNPHISEFVPDELFKTKIFPVLYKHLFANGAKYHFTFAYKGNIKPADIELVETFKPARVKRDPTDKEWQDASDKTTASLKVY